MTALSRRAFLSVVAGASIASLAACSPTTTSPLILGCGEPGGSYLEFGELLAAATRTSRAVAIRPLATEGSIDNLRLLSEGRVDLALALVDAAAEAGGDVVAIGRVYQNYLQCIVRADSGISRMSDLAGRTVSLGAPGSGAAATARRLLVAADLDPATASGPATVERSFREAVDDLAERRIDAFFWSGGVPTPQIASLAARVPVSVIDTTTALDALVARYPDVYAATTIPSGVYGAERAVPTVGVANLLLARADLSAELARALVDALIDDAPALVSPDALGIQYLTPASLIDTTPVALHPAAERRYRERYG